jgi:AcrR family transcriptional regulator
MWRTDDRPPPEAVLVRREQILRSARSAIASKGAESVRLIDIAQVAGVSIGALQHHFGSRDALVFDAYRLQTADALQAATALADDTIDPWEGLVAVFRYLGSPDDNDAASWIELSATAVRVPTLREIVDEVNAKWAELVADILQRGIEQGSFHPVLSSDDLLESILALLDGMEVAISNRRADPADIATRLIEAADLLVGHSPAPGS